MSNIGRRIVLLCLACASSLAGGAAAAAGERYFAQLIYNHVTPQIEMRGVHPLTEQEAKTTPHYLFRYDENGRLVEIQRHHPESWKQHPLTHMGKVVRIAVSYAPGREERRFFDADGKPMRNIRAVAREVYTIDADGFRSALQFLDEEGQPMESNWKIARYAWERRGDLVIERRFDKAGRPVAVSTYFPFQTTAIRYGANGMSEGCFNLDDALQVSNSPTGVASYHDTYVDGDHISWEYRDREGRPVLSGRYSKATKSYDAQGNVVKVEYTAPDGRVVNTERFSYP